MRLPWLPAVLLLALTGCATKPLLVQEEPDGIGGTGISSYQVVQGPDGIGGTGIIGPVTGYSRNESQPDNILLEVNELVVAVNLSATLHNQDSINFNPAPGQLIALALPASTAEPVHLALLEPADNPLTELARLGARPLQFNISGVLQKSGEGYRIAGMQVSLTKRMKQKLDASAAGALRVHAAAGVTRHGRVRLRRIFTVTPVDLPLRDTPRPSGGGALDKPEAVRTQTPQPAASSSTDTPGIVQRPEVIRPRVRPVEPHIVVPAPRIEPPTRPEPTGRPPQVDTPPVIDRPQPVRIEPIAIDGADRTGVRN